MTTATANRGKHGKLENGDEREMLSVVATPEAIAELNKQRGATGLTKRRIVLLGIFAFANLKPDQRDALIKKHPLTA